LLTFAIFTSEKGTQVAQHKSAKKRIRTNERKRIRNRTYISSLRTAIKKFTTAATTGGTTEAVNKLFIEAQSLLGKAASKGILHKNNIARKTGRLSKILKAAGSAPAATTTAKTKTAAPKKAATAAPKAKTATKAKTTTAAKKKAPSKPAKKTTKK
jgi:small subunit ribosomal protein S20